FLLQPQPNVARIVGGVLQSRLGYEWNSISFRVGDCYRLDLATGPRAGALEGSAIAHQRRASSLARSLSENRKLRGRDRRGRMGCLGGDLSAPNDARRGGTRWGRVPPFHGVARFVRVNRRRVPLLWRNVFIDVRYLSALRTGRNQRR